MTINVRNISDQIVDLIRERILSGAIKPNVPIRQDALASELGVSKIPLREALARLEQFGLVTSHPNRGFVVRAMSTDEAEEIFALRLALEPDAVVAGALLADDRERELAITALATFKLEAAHRSVSGGAHNRAFHLSLIAPSHQPLKTDILERLHILADRYVCKHLEPLGRDHRADAEHDEMLAAWLAKDVASLAAVTRRHISATLNDLREQFTHELSTA
jgi:DNA-binding GntR family transcriptional regulator